jgi:hypothetical protein
MDYNEYARKMAQAMDNIREQLKQQRDEFGTVLPEFVELCAPKPKRVVKEQKPLDPSKLPDILKHITLKGTLEHAVPYKNKLILFTDISVAAVTVDEVMGRAPKAK